MQGRWPKVTR